jgi:hypothetical protein
MPRYDYPLKLPIRVHDVGAYHVWMVIKTCCITNDLPWQRQQATGQRLVQPGSGNSGSTTANSGLTWTLLIYLLTCAICPTRCQALAQTQTQWTVCRPFSNVL